MRPPTPLKRRWTKPLLKLRLLPLKLLLLPKLPWTPLLPLLRRLLTLPTRLLATKPTHPIQRKGPFGVPFLLWAI